jgi:hypothetical protein
MAKRSTWNVQLEAYYAALDEFSHHSALHEGAVSTPALTKHATWK